MTENTCRVCGASRLAAFLEIKGYTLTRCADCGFVFTPSAADGSQSELYDKEYFEGETARFEAGTINRALPPSKLWMIDKFLSRPGFRRMLEIGPSTNGGLVKHFLGQPGREIQCVEISEYASAYLNENGIPAFHGTIEDFHPDKEFDLVIATEVIEHAADPQAFVGAISHALGEQGAVFLTTGNADSLPARRQGAQWYYYEPPVHICYFNNRNIRLLLRQQGFSRVTVINTGFKWIEAALRRKVAWAIPIIGRLQLSTGMVVFAQK